MCENDHKSIEICTEIEDFDRTLDIFGRIFVTCQAVIISPAFASAVNSGKSKSLYMYIVHCMYRCQHFSRILSGVKLLSYNALCAVEVKVSIDASVNPLMLCITVVLPTCSSYLHAEWASFDKILRGDKRFDGKVKRYRAKQSSMGIFANVS